MRKAFEFVGSLIVSSTFSHTQTTNPLCFNCASHVTSIIAHTGQIVWQCNFCDEEGIITNWHKTVWDMTDFSYKKLS